MLKSAVWFITEKCNLNCPYCYEKDVLKRLPSKDLPYTIWVEAWNKLKPETLDITGGEPFVVSDFVQLLEMLDPAIKIAITTNTKADLTEFILKIKPDKVISMTLSAHPSTMNSELFLGKVLMLKNRGFNITVNFVGYPEQMWLIPAYKQRFESMGIRFHIDTFVYNDLTTFKYSDLELSFLKNYIMSDRNNLLDSKEAPASCSAGQNHIQVYPDGTAFACMRDFLIDAKPLGNILTGLELANDLRYCSNINLCAGCDKDKVTIEPLKVSLV
jgi:MoaA/NifB/PqqE/SkfB family radical SAM enzyme